MGAQNGPDATADHVRVAPRPPVTAYDVVVIVLASLAAAGAGRARRLR